MKSLVPISLLAITVLCWGATSRAADDPSQPTVEPADQTTAVDEPKECTTESLAGAYGIQMQGVHVRGRKEIPYTAVRTANFDGKGNTTGKGMANINGRTFTIAVKGTYTVADDCSVTVDAEQIIADGTKAEPYKQYGVLVDGGDAILIMQTVGRRTQFGRYEKY